MTVGGRPVSAEAPAIGGTPGGVPSGGAAAPGSGAWAVVGGGGGVEGVGDWARASGQSGNSDSVAKRRSCALACSSVPAGRPAATWARADSARSDGFINWQSRLVRRPAPSADHRQLVAAIRGSPAR